ncbi:MAG: cytochrome c3 family protein [Myxococcota bacterium]
MIPLAAVGALALVVTATAAGLYDYTDEELEGPEQPIQFSHKIHAGSVENDDLGIACLYCHGPAEKSQHATIPAVSICMGCHTYVAEGRTEGSAEEIAKLREYYASGESIPWIRIHNLPEHVQFRHFRHVRAGVQCQTCHGQVEEMNRVYLVPDTVLRPYSLYLPAAKLEMGWCMHCHLKPEVGASDDCSACHY